MSILAAKCPCCGRDIGIQEHTEEYVCVFCGAKLNVSALKTELITPEEGKEPTPASGSPSERPAEKPKEEKRTHGEHSHRSDRRRSKAEEETPELTEEEKNEQLRRKAEFKEELHSTVRQIDELRARRPKLEAKLRTSSALTIGGVALAVAGAIGILLFAEREEGGELALVICAALGVIAVFMLVSSFMQRKNVKKQQKRLEEAIVEKKQKRDILIGRLNKINKLLHIHHDGHENHGG